MRVLSRLFLLVGFGASMALPGAVQADIPQAQRDALLAIHDATNGDNWDNNSGWGDASGTECSWFGITCDGSGDNVDVLSLPDNNLTGNVPPEIGELTNLRILQFEQNAIGQSIPAELGNLGQLEELDLSGNVLTGDIPSNLINLDSLNTVDLRWNGVHTDDSTLETFLDQRHPDGDVSATQTLDAGGLGTTEVGSSEADLGWSQVDYSQAGGYRVFVSTNSDGPFSEGTEVTSKSTTSATIMGLLECTSYYAHVRSFTSPHADNENEVESDGETGNQISFDTSGCGSDDDGYSNGGDDDGGGGYGGGGCTLNPAGRFDPVLPGLFLVAALYLLVRRRLNA